MAEAPLPLELQQLYDIGFAHYRAGEYAQANAAIERLLSHTPNYGSGLLLKAVVQPQEHRLLGLALTAAARRKSSLNGENWFNWGVFLNEAQAPALALEAYRRAIALNPLHCGALGNGAEKLRLHEHFEEALIAAERHQMLEPETINGYVNAGVSHCFLWNLDAADIAFAKGVELSLQQGKDPAPVWWEWSHSLLARKRHKESWAAYEYRFACGHLNGVNDIPFPYPKWDGKADISKKHIMLYGEQGIGDQIMFASAFRELADKAGKVSIACFEGIASLFAASFPDFTIIPLPSGQAGYDKIEELRNPQGAGKGIDYVLPMGSLMHFFRNAQADYPGLAYLRASDAARERWRKIIPDKKAEKTKLRIGVCWQTNPAKGRFESSRRAGHKTMPITRLDPIGTVEGIEAYSLWNHDLALSGASPKWIKDVSNKLTTLDETAAMLERLDLVITVDTGVAHLAGSLGKKVWLLLHHHGDCRWGMPVDERSYWYPDVFQFWQQEAREWDEVIERVVAKLQAEYGLKAGA
jgi:Glycosyltransferase family 9 (heptosyltransferase)